MAWLLENVLVLMFNPPEARSKLNTPPVVVAQFWVNNEPAMCTIEERDVAKGWIAATPPTPPTPAAPSARLLLKVDD